MKKFQPPVQQDLFKYTSNDDSLSHQELDQKYFDLFSWYVPLAFSTPLAFCRFEEGDTLYDSRKAVGTNWSETLKHVKNCIQITFPQKAILRKLNQSVDSMFESNWDSKIELDFFTFKNSQVESKEHIKMTQGALYTFLWKGDPQLLKLGSQPPPVPSTYSLKNEGLFKLQLQKTGDRFLTKLLQSNNFTELFLMPFDRTNSLLRNKFIAISDNIKESGITVDVFYDRPENIGEEVFIPTLQLVCWVINHDDKSILYEAVKNSLYKPSSSKQNKNDQFRIDRHGVYHVIRQRR